MNRNSFYHGSPPRKECRAIPPSRNQISLLKIGEGWLQNPYQLPVVAGLHSVLSRLLDLSEELTSPAQRERWKRFRAELPEISLGEAGEKKWIEPACTHRS